jgi:superfamily II RNA helicase
MFTGISKMRLRMAESMELKQEEVTVERVLSKKEERERKKALARKAAASADRKEKEAGEDSKKWEVWKQLRPEFTAAEAMKFLEDVSPALQKRIFAELISKKMDPNHEAFLRLLQLSVSGGKVSADVIAIAKELRFLDLAKCLASPGSNCFDSKWCEAQLCLLSSDLPRAFGVVDSRVLFKPDPWQVQLLDAIDKKESCVVVAATSAGKTFSQYYAMRQVLKESHDALCVYVCPTKALCHQVLAGVDARFQKFYAEPTSVVAGMFTKDQRKDIERCQILVTVPECIDILLLQPTEEGQKWVGRLKWVIFDEVHCINEFQRGPVWERILHVLGDRVPFLALSATVGEPERFCAWLQSSRPSQKVNLIVYSERYNDLRIGVATNEKESGVAVRDLHPCCFVSAAMLCGEFAAFPQMVSLEPRDAWSLYCEMENAEKKFGPALEGLRPAEFFRGPVIITRARAKEWGEQLKARLIDWGKKSVAAVEMVLKPFQNKLSPRDVAMPERQCVDSAVYSV